MTRIGCFYLDGVAVGRDATAARAWFEKASAGVSSPEGHYRYARMVLSGEGGPQDNEHGMLYLMQSGGAYYPSALYDLAVIRENGHFKTGIDMVAAYRFAYIGYLSCEPDERPRFQSLFLHISEKLRPEEIEHAKEMADKDLIEKRVRSDRWGERSAPPLF